MQPKKMSVSTAFAMAVNDPNCQVGAKRFDMSCELRINITEG